MEGFMEARAMGMGMGDTGGRKAGRKQARQDGVALTEGVNQIEEDGEALLSKKGWKYTASHHIVSTVTSPGRLQPYSASTSAPCSKPSSSSSE